MLFFVFFLPSLFYSNYIHLLFRLIGYWNAKKQMHEWTEKSFQQIYQ